MTDPTLPATAAPPSLPRSVPSTLDERVAAYSSNVLPSDYTFEPTLSVDDNYMILTLIYARLSTSKRGNMACILVDPRGCASDAARHGATSSSNGATAADDDGEPPAKRARATSPSPQPFQRYPGRILAHSNNTPEPHTVPSPSNTDAATSEGGGKPARTGKKAQQSPFLARASNFPELHARRAPCASPRDQGPPQQARRRTSHSRLPGVPASAGRGGRDAPRVPPTDERTGGRRAVQA